MIRGAVQRNSCPQGKAWGCQATVWGGRKHVWRVVFWCLMSFQREAQTPGQPLAGCSLALSCRVTRRGKCHMLCTAPGTIVGCAYDKAPGTNSQSSLRLTSIESVLPSSHLILCRPLLLLPPIPPSIRVFSNESTLRMRWPKYWSFSFSIITSKEIPGLISFRMDWLPTRLVCP